MVDTFTSLQLMRYLYHECDTTGCQILEELVHTDIELAEELESMRVAKLELPLALFSAHPKSIQEVLHYAQL